jgi:aminoglycoside phosphotransferase family enzyme
VKSVDAEKINELAEQGEFEVIETHISWILLGEDAYKIKKAVKFSFLDFSTLEKRKFLCEEEVRLNKRLAPDVYLGIVPITEKNGKPEINGSGKAVEYAIRMKRLPQEARMDVLLGKENVSGEHVQEIAAIVAEFHSRIDIIKEKGYGSAEIVRKQIDDLKDFRETVEEGCGLGEKVDFIVGKCDEFIGKNQEMFSKRQEKGRIRDCHGDLHSANIFITERIVIFDCIEFSKDFRFVDTASEIAFMAMDLDAFGREDLSKFFIDSYVKFSGDTEALEMLRIYKCYRANVRAKIAAIDYSQHPGEEPKERIRKYIGLAERYAKELSA